MTLFHRFLDIQSTPKVYPTCSVIPCIVNIGWGDNRIIIKQRAILHEKIRKRFGITLFHLRLRFQENQL